MLKTYLNNTPRQAMNDNQHVDLEPAPFLKSPGRGDAII